MKQQNPAQAGNQPNKNPAQQTGEEHGKIKGRQVTDRTMPEDDLARGAEGGAGRGGLGRQQSG